MAPAFKPKVFAYAELGAVLKRWRGGKFRSAFALCEAAKFTFSYGVYASYERGEDLATPQALVEIAQFLQEEVREALVVWARVQMPTEDLREFFDPAQILGTALQKGDTAPDPRPYSISSNSIPPSEFDNTWVFDAPERKALEANPWLVHFFVRLGMTYPEVVRFEALGLKTKPAVDRFVRKFIQRWIEDERIQMTSDGFKLAKQYFHLPKNEQWHRVRASMMDMALEEVLPQLHSEALRAKQGHRTLTTRILTEEQRLRFIEKLSALESEFFAQPYVGNESASPRSPCSLIMLLAPRQMPLPREATGVRKKS